MDVVHRDEVVKCPRPTVIKANMLDRLVGARSQYAVVLAYCGDVDAAEQEMARLEPAYTPRAATSYRR